LVTPRITAPSFINLSARNTTHGISQDSRRALHLHI
jgi:hypothetical protein